MFETLEEADEVNSECAFCGRSKFKVVTSSGTDGISYDLIRCSDEHCQTHCKWTHKGESITLRSANEDTVAIASGW